MPYIFNVDMAEKLKLIIDLDRIGELDRLITEDPQILTLSLERDVYCNLLYYAMKKQNGPIVKCIFKHCNDINLSLITEKTNIKYDISVILQMSIYMATESYDKMIQEIISYLKQLKKQEFCEILEIINKSDCNFFSELITFQRIEFILELLALGILPKEIDLRCQIKSFKFGEITISDANLISIVVLMSNPSALKTLLIALDRASMTDLILQHKSVEIPKKWRGINDPTALLIIKCLNQVHDNLNIPNRGLSLSCYCEDLFQINKTYESLIEALKFSEQDIIVLDMLLIAGVNPRTFNSLLLRQQELWKNIIEYTIKNSVMCFYELMISNGINLSSEIMSQIITFALSASHSILNPYQHTLCVANQSLLFFARHKVQMSQKSVDSIIQENVTRYQSKFLLLTLKLAMLGFQAWRQNQPLREEETCARNPAYCKKLVNLINTVIVEKWHIIKPLVDGDHQLFIKKFKDKMMNIALRKSEIEKGLQEIIVELNVGPIPQLMIIQVVDEEQRKDFIQNFARQVMCYFNEERVTFRFWNEYKEQTDLFNRIEKVAINYVQQLQQLDKETMSQLVKDLALSNFSIREISTIIEKTINSHSKAEKRYLKRADRNEIRHVKAKRNTIKM